MRADPSPRSSSAPTDADGPPGRSSPTLERAIAVTVLYADLFDYPLTEDELFRRLIEVKPERSAFERAVERMVGAQLRRRGPYLTWRDREHLAQIRERRAAVSSRHWTVAQRYGHWLRWIPFVRMVAVSGALARGNAQENGDVDLFCVTDPNRLWLARLWLVPLARCTRAFGGTTLPDLCPNYLLTTETLEVDARNLFTAYETVQTVPLWGEAVFRAFRSANPWTERFLPRAGRATRAAPTEETSKGPTEALGGPDEDPTGPPGEDPTGETYPAKPWPTRMVERLLGGRLGDFFDRGLHRLSLHFFRRRAERAGWDWTQIRKAYRRNRYTVPMGGYADVVERLLARAVSETFPAEVVETLLDRLFPKRAGGEAPGDGPKGEDVGEDRPDRERYAWEKIFARDYSRAPTPNVDSEPAEPTP